MMRFSLAFVLGLILFNGFNLQAEVKVPFWRTIEEDALTDKAGNPLFGAERKARLKLLEDAYGAKLYVLPAEFKKLPKKVKKKVNGVVFHDSIYEEPRFIRGKRNPQIESNKAINKINRDFGIQDFDEKWNEYTVLKGLVPEIAPPEMHLATDYAKQKVTDIERPVAEAKWAALEKRYSAGPEADAELLTMTRNKKDDIVKLLTIQDRINSAPGMGRSILKIRDANHSEGKLPISDKDWGDLYVNFLVKGKPLITEDTGQNELLSIPYVSGRILDRMLGDNSESVIVQHMVKIKRELRVHINNGEILEGASFLRFYKLNEYVKPEEVQKIEESLKTILLPRLRELGYDGLSASPDVALLEDGRVMILDFNDGNYSGYLSPYEDIYTANLFAERMSGKRTPFLEEFDGFSALPLGKKKSDALRAITKKYEEFFEGDVSQAFWDRVGRNHMNLLAQNPTPENFRRVLQSMKDGGLNKKVMDAGQVYMQFIAEVQDRWPGLTLESSERLKWVNYMNTVEPGVFTQIDDKGHFIDTEIKNAKEGSCFVFKRVALPNP